VQEKSSVAAGFAFY